LIADFRNERLGRISLDKTEDNEQLVWVWNRIK
jgi:hypothetical protein